MTFSSSEEHSSNARGRLAWAHEYQATKELTWPLLGLSLPSRILAAPTGPCRPPSRLGWNTTGVQSRHTPVCSHPSLPPKDGFVKYIRALYRRAPASPIRSAQSVTRSRPGGRRFRGRPRGRPTRSPSTAARPFFCLLIRVHPRPNCLSSPCHPTPSLRSLPSPSIRGPKPQSRPPKTAPATAPSPPPIPTSPANTPAPPPIPSRRASPLATPQTAPAGHPIPSPASPSTL